MSRVHYYAGYVMPIGFALLALWSLISFLRNREPSGWFWNLLAVAQIVLGAQIAIGLILLLSGLEPATDTAWLHYAYGGLFPAAVLVAAHRYAAKHTPAAWIIFGFAALVNFGLTVRAFMTGVG